MLPLHQSALSIFNYYIWKYLAELPLKNLDKSNQICNNNVAWHSAMFQILDRSGQRICVYV